MNKHRQLAFNESLLVDSPYLKSNIKADQTNPFKCICVPCKEEKRTKYTIQFESLRGHLKSLKHFETAKSKTDKEDIQNAIKYIKSGYKNTEVKFSTDNPSKDPKSIPADKIEEESETELTPKHIETFEEEKEPPSEAKINSTFDKSSLRYFRFYIAHFLMTNSLPFNLTEKLVQLIKKSIANHSAEEISNYSVNRKHVSNISTYCIGPSIKDMYLKMLAISPFSIAIDEGKTKDNVQYLAINARFFANQNDIKTQTKLIALIHMEESQTGLEIFKKLTNLLFTGPDGMERKKNIMGVASDRGSNMLSSKEVGGAGAANRLQAELPHIVLIHDICHALNLVLKSCIDSFPKEFTKIITKICTMFSQSPKQCAILKGIQKKLQLTNKNAKILQVKRYVETRWSSFEECLSRILEIKESLKVYFEENGAGEQKNYLSKHNILLFQLLHCLISKVNVYIKLFETDNLDLISIVRNLKECGAMFGDFIFKVTALNSEEEFVDKDQLFRKLKPYFLKDQTKEIEYTEMKRNFEEFKCYFLMQHPNFNEDSKELDEEEKKNFFEAAQSFLLKALEGIRERLPWDDNQILLLSDAFLLKNQAAPTQLNRLASIFTNVIDKDELSKFHLETARLTFTGLDIKKRIKKGVENYLEGWGQVKNEFPLIFRLARALWTLPYSSACVERSFSQMNIIKTVKRNRLSLENLESCLLFKQANMREKRESNNLGETEESEEEPRITDDMFSRYKNIPKSTQISSGYKELQQTNSEKLPNVLPFEMKEKEMENETDHFQKKLSIISSSFINPFANSDISSYNNFPANNPSFIPYLFNNPLVLNNNEQRFLFGVPYPIMSAPDNFFKDDIAKTIPENTKDQLSSRRKPSPLFNPNIKQTKLSVKKPTGQMELETDIQEERNI